MSWINAARDVLENGCKRVNIQTGVARTGDTTMPGELDDYHEAKRSKQKGRAVLLDHFTASMLVQIYDKLNDTNKAKFDGLPLTRAVDVGWKLVR